MGFYGDRKLTAEEAKKLRETDIGPPYFRDFLPPVIKKNYGQWKEHDILSAGLMVHTAESGDKIWTIRVATPRLIATDTVREACDIADKYCDGHLRWTSRNNIEFLVSDEKKVEPIQKELKERGFLMGGIGYRISNVVHTQGWVHCHGAATDASGLVKSMMDELAEYFTTKELPNKLRLAVACCPNMCGAVHCSDIAVVAIHTTVPIIDHDKLGKICEIPTSIASCPTKAISPYPEKKSVKIKDEKCMYCGNCFTVCPAFDPFDTERDGCAIVIGGKVNCLRTNTKFARLVVPFISNRPPRWPKVVAIIKHIIELYAKHARKHERVGEWVDRIGWERFFKLSGITFTYQCIDDFTFMRDTFRNASTFKW
ncbi:MAG: dissimilatory-type sulfite reductase subunit beta [Nitrospira sp.]|nr:dissimilatory-type sulfite reductase subunit beta [Nitrospira sp.]